jgi:very-short-patch-repair endonuclease
MKSPSTITPASAAKSGKTPAPSTEDFLWQYLNGSRFESARFKRQEPLGDFTVDFVSLDRKLVVELHRGEDMIFAPENKTRDRWLKEQGYTILRFWDNEVTRDTAGVLKTIKHRLDASPPGSPHPGERRRG